MGQFFHIGIHRACLIGKSGPIIKRLMGFSLYRRLMRFQLQTLEECRSFLPIFEPMSRNGIFKPARTSFRISQLSPYISIQTCTCGRIRVAFHTWRTVGSSNVLSGKNVWDSSPSGGSVGAFAFFHIPGGKIALSPPGFGTTCADSCSFSFALISANVAIISLL